MLISKTEGFLNGLRDHRAFEIVRGRRWGYEVLSAEGLFPDDVQLTFNTKPLRVESLHKSLNVGLLVSEIFDYLGGPLVFVNGRDNQRESPQNDAGNFKPAHPF